MSGQYVYHMNGWNDETRQCPPVKWLEAYTTKVIDQDRAFMSGPQPAGHAKDWTLIKSDGSAGKTSDESWKMLAEVYGPFAAQHHDPRFIVAWETNDGWEAFGWADVHFNLHGPAPETKTDSDGKKWHGSGPGAFSFKWTGKEEKDIKLKETRIFADSTPAVKVMLQNQHINGEQLAGIIASS